MRRRSRSSAAATPRDTPPRARGGSSRASRLLADLREELRRAGAVAGARSGSDTGLTADEHPLDLEVVVEDDHVGRAARVQPAGVGGADDARRARRVAASSASRERDAERVEVPDRLDHRQRAAGEDAVRAARDAVADLDVDAAEAVRAVARRPAPAIASVTSATRPAAARQTTRAVSAARWMPSRMIWTTTSSRASAAPAMPGIAVAEAAASR